MESPKEIPLFQLFVVYFLDYCDFLSADSLTHATLLLYYSSRLYRSRAHEAPETTKDMIRAMAKPNREFSMPLTRFMPNSEAMSVGNIMIIDTDVSVRITVFMLLLMMLE